MGELERSLEPALYKELVHTPEEVNARIDQLAVEIAEDHPDQPPIIIALLMGGAPFATKLAFSLARQYPNMHPRLGFMEVTAYGKERTVGEARITQDVSPKIEIRDKRVIVADDIAHTRTTVVSSTNHLLSTHGASGVRIAMLVNRITPNKIADVPIDYIGFDFYGEEWLTGMGLDDTEGIGPEGNRWAEFIAIALDPPEQRSV